MINLFCLHLHLWDFAIVDMVCHHSKFEFLFWLSRYRFCFFFFFVFNVFGCGCISFFTANRSDPVSGERFEFGIRSRLCIFVVLFPRSFTTFEQIYHFSLSLYNLNLLLWAQPTIVYVFPWQFLFFRFFLHKCTTVLYRPISVF